MHSQLQIYITGSILTTVAIWERKKEIYIYLSRKMKFRLKNKQHKKEPSTKLCTNRWMFFKLAEQVSGFILKHVLFI